MHHSQQGSGPGTHQHPSLLSQGLSSLLPNQLAPQGESPASEEGTSWARGSREDVRSCSPALWRRDAVPITVIFPQGRARDARVYVGHGVPVPEKQQVEAFPRWGGTCPASPTTPTFPTRQQVRPSLLEEAWEKRGKGRASSQRSQKPQPYLVWESLTPPIGLWDPGRT